MKLEKFPFCTIEAYESTIWPNSTTIRSKKIDRHYLLIELN